MKQPDERLKLIIAVQAAVEKKTNEVDILRAAVELIDAFSPHFNWTGFYMLRSDMLHVGPYVGPVTEHVMIPLNAGICGAAASQKKTVVVEDVRQDPRFIACSVTTRSEIVIPLMDGDQVLGELDIDSDQVGNFSVDDRQMLEEIARIISKRLIAVAQ